VRTSVDVHNYLVERDVQHELFAARGRFRVPERIATVLDLPPDEVGKVLVFEGPGGPVAAIVPIGSKVDHHRLQKASGQATLASADDHRTFELTEYLPESTPPAGLPGRFATVIDPSLAREDVLYFPGGEARAILKIRGKDLVKATGAKVASIVASEGDRANR
jgi:prolyl-tRNA editing enzyme YbaK/EbsC (Cys-tRNA(Pro) deacylase)